MKRRLVIAVEVEDHGVELDTSGLAIYVEGLDGFSNACVWEQNEFVCDVEENHLDVHYVLDSAFAA